MRWMSRASAVCLCGVGLASCSTEADQSGVGDVDASLEQTESATADELSDNSSPSASPDAASAVTDDTDTSANTSELDNTLTDDTAGEVTLSDDSTGASSNTNPAEQDAAGPSTQADAGGEPSAAPSADAGAALDAGGSAEGGALLDAAQPPTSEASVGPNLAELNTSCDDGACSAGLTPVHFYGIAGPNGPEFCWCTIPCAENADVCPDGTQCVTVSDGPGEVCYVP